MSVLISCCDHLCPKSLSNFDIFIYYYFWCLVLNCKCMGLRIQVQNVPAWWRVVNPSELFKWYLVMDRVPWNWGFLQLEIYGENRLNASRTSRRHLYIFFCTKCCPFWSFFNTLNFETYTPKPTVQKWDASLLVNLWLSSGILLPYLVTSSPLHHLLLLQTHNWNNWGWV